jgi:hypothetical protein
MCVGKKKHLAAPGACREQEIECVCEGEREGKVEEELCVCVCVCVFSVKPAFPLYLKSLARHAGGLKRCSRDCPGVFVVASLEETQGGALVGWRWHHSRERGDFSHVLTACIQTTSLKGARRGCSGGCYEPTCQMLLFPYTQGSEGKKESIV